MPRIDSFHLSYSDQKHATKEGSAGAFKPKNFLQLRQSGSIYVVADGLGGSQMGQIASAIAIETLLKDYFKTPEVPLEKRLRNTLQHIHQNLITNSQTDKVGSEKMMTTVVIAIIRNNRLYVVNVGNNYAYLVRNGKIRQITSHLSSTHEKLQTGSIIDTGAGVLGGWRDLEIETHLPVRLRPKDLILLCTDSLARNTTSDDLLKILPSAGNAEQIAEQLIHLAKERDSSGNITAFVIKYGRNYSLPTALPVKASVLAGVGVLVLAMLTLISLYLFFIQPKPDISSLTPIPLPSLPASPTAFAKVVDCQYTIQDGDIAGSIAEKFDTDLSHLFREDGSQDDFDFLSTNEVLIINDISGETCQAGDGKPLPSSHIP